MKIGAEELYRSIANDPQMNGKILPNEYGQQYDHSNANRQQATVRNGTFGPLNGKNNSIKYLF